MLIVSMFVVWVVAAFAVGAILFGVAAALTGRATGLAEMPPDRRPVALPQHRPADAEDLRGVRFDLAFRGYRMDEVDALLDHLGGDLAARDEEIAVLRDRLREKQQDG